MHYWCPMTKCAGHIAWLPPGVFLPNQQMWVCEHISACSGRKMLCNLFHVPSQIPSTVPIYGASVSTYVHIYIHKSRDLPILYIYMYIYIVSAGPHCHIHPPFSHTHTHMTQALPKKQPSPGWCVRGDLDPLIFLCLFPPVTFHG